MADQTKNLEQQIEDILPEDLARTFESGYYVLKGQHEHMEDLLNHGGVLLRKAARRFSPTQLVIGLAAVATVAVYLIGQATDDE